LCDDYKAPYQWIEEVTMASAPLAQIEQRIITGEYFAIGVERVWLIDPRRRLVYLYRSATDSERLTVHDTLRGEGVLEGFSLSLRDFFDD
jgi:Uma2 family endonuclease